MLRLCDSATAARMLLQLTIAEKRGVMQSWAWPVKVTCSSVRKADGQSRGDDEGFYRLGISSGSFVAG